MAVVKRSLFLDCNSGTNLVGLPRFCGTGNSLFPITLRPTAEALIPGINVLLFNFDSGKQLPRKGLYFLGFASLMSESGVR